MLNIIKSILVLTIACSTSICVGCGNVNFQPPPEDKVIKLDQPGESPKAKEREYKHGDAVSLIKNDGTFVVEAYIEEKDAEKDYSVRTGSGRLTKYESYPPSQIFPAPWANYRNLKIGDAVTADISAIFRKRELSHTCRQTRTELFPSSTATIQKSSAFM